MMIGEVVCFQFLLSLFSSQDLTFPLFAVLFPYHPVSKGCASCFVSFTPCLSDCHLDSHPLLSLFLVVATAVYQDSYSLFYIRLTFFQRWLQLSSWLRPHILLLICPVFPRLVPKVWQTALSRFGFNFLFFNLQVIWRLHNFLSSCLPRSVGFV